MSVLVVHASTIAALLFDEPGADDVADKLENATLIAPIILPHDVACLCLDKYRQNPDTGEQYLAMLSLLDDMDLILVELEEEAVVRHAIGHDISINQAYYRYLCKRFETSLVAIDTAGIANDCSYGSAGLESSKN